jgi:hypothetical protein
VCGVKIETSPASFRFTSSAKRQRGILLKVEGAVIVIADVYDRPLALIHQNFRNYWQGSSWSAEESDREVIPHRFTEPRRAMAPGTPLRPSSQNIISFE